ncbi:Ig-like domain-containing protein [Streptomyces sp. SDT5-1]|uniref:Ig-like domain-containing protein n=1 Tax=Streptomyces sp. SDT5-1 TaxID=3406418 RepID=UPI003FD36861
MRAAVRRARHAGATLGAVLTGAGLIGALAGCTSDTTFDKPPSARELIRVTPDDRTKGVRTQQPLRVTVPEGRLQSVRVVEVRDAEERAVPGRLEHDAMRWRPAGRDRLALAAQYRVDAVAVDGHGRRVARHTTFTTDVPDKRFIGYVTPEHRARVGTGMIVRIAFNRRIENRAAVQRAIRVTARPRVAIAPHWFGHDRLDFRPRRYWRPGTRVTVDLGLRDVRAAPGVYGRQDKTFTFTVGRSQVSVVDAAAHTMRVFRNGRLAETVPITAGAPTSTTYNGKMVVSEMLDVTRMDGRTVGFGGEYDIPDVPHAIRLTDSGTFLHGNYWSGGVFGNSNVSHGCVGLRDVKGGGSWTPAGRFFDRTLIGDVVEVRNSADKKVAADNGLGGWNMDWKRWRAGGARAGGA